jgi:hypothetical protein
MHDNPMLLGAACLEANQDRIMAGKDYVLQDDFYAAWHAGS